MKRSPIKRRTAMIRVNRKRRITAFAKAFRSKDRVLFGNLGPCYVCGRHASSIDPVQNAHEPARSLGGTYLDVIPMHASEHWIQEENAHFFEERGLDPAELAARFQNAWVEYARRNGIEP